MTTATLTKAQSMMAGVTLGTDREKMLLVGGPGTQKSTTIVNLAKMYPDVTVAVIDPDDGIQKLVRSEMFGGWEKLPNLAYLPVSDWPGVSDMYDVVKEHLTYGDWFCIDMAHLCRAFVIEWYISDTKGMTVKEYKTKLKQEGKRISFGGLDPDDWNVISLHWNDVFAHALRRLPCNCLFTTAAEPLIVDRNGSVLDKSVPKQWQQVGVKAAGEKNLPYNVHTTLLLTSEEKGGKLSWYMKTVGKDRGRKPVDAEFSNLWLDYAIAVGIDASASPGRKP